MTLILLLSLFYDQLKDGTIFILVFTLSDGLIVTRETPFRILLPDNAVLRLALFHEMHNSPLAGHPGFHKFFSYISRLFVGPNLRHDILEFVSNLSWMSNRQTTQWTCVWHYYAFTNPWSTLARHLYGSHCKSSSLANIWFYLRRCWSFFLKWHTSFQHAFKSLRLTWHNFFLIILFRLHGFST